jgi:peptidyl-prolyl cis-trans isomerase A (cyclophilin A)
MLALFAAAHAAAPEVPPSTPLRRAEPPGWCLSAVPRAGRMPKPDREAFAAAAAFLSESSRDPAAVARWWATFEPGLAALPPHPALDALRVAVDAILLPTGDPTAAVALADAFPKDLCLATSAAAATFAAGDLDTARGYVGRAWIPAPSADLAYVLGEIVLSEGEVERVPGILAQGLALDPEHDGLRRLRARLALARGGSATEDLAYLQQKGDRSLDPMLMTAHYEENRMDDYLRLAVQVSPPLGLLPLGKDDPAPLATLRKALGAEEPGSPVRVVLDTTEGSIPCTLFVDQAPYTVAMFVGFATGAQPWTDPRTGAAGEGPLYHDVSFHRVIPQFMIQGGDPLGEGVGGPGYQFHDEVRPDLRFDRAGRLAMANAGPGTNGSQFFVTEAPTPHLDGKHTIFGQCDAPEVVSSIARVPRDARDAPNTPVVLRAVRLAPPDAQ